MRICSVGPMVKRRPISQTLSSGNVWRFLVGIYYHDNCRVSRMKTSNATNLNCKNWIALSIILQCEKRTTLRTPNNQRQPFWFDKRGKKLILLACRRWQIYKTYLEKCILLQNVKWQRNRCTFIWGDVCWHVWGFFSLFGVLLSLH